MIAEAADKGGLNIHSLRFDYDFKYWAPMNTTDESGFSNLFSSVKQISSRMKVQYYQNLETTLNDCKNEKEKNRFDSKIPHGHEKRASHEIVMERPPRIFENVE
jgi:hypothetical protein